MTHKSNPNVYDPTDPWPGDPNHPAQIRIRKEEAEREKNNPQPKSPRIMSSIIVQHTLTTTITIGLTEEEARALYLLSSFNTGTILESLKPVSRDFDKHEQGFLALFHKIHNEMPAELERIATARAAFKR